MLFEGRTVFVLWKRELLRMLTEPTRVLGVVIQPLMFWFVIGSGFVPSFRLAGNEALNYQYFFFPGVLALVILFSAIFSTITVIEDRVSGFLQAVLIGPGSRTALVLGKMAGVVCIACIQALLFLVVAPFAGISLEQMNFALVLLLTVLGAISMSGLGFVFAWVTESSAVYHALMSIILIPMWILSGAMFPAQTGWIHTVLLLNPLGWLVAGFRAAFAAGQAPLGSVPSALTIEVCLIYLSLFSIFIVGIGVWVCHRRR
jgi:ABC-2 type transport system permease protein